MRSRSRSARGELARARTDADAAAAQLAAVERENRLLRNALDLVPQGVVLVDRQGRELSRNQAAEGLVDARHGDALAAHLLEAVVEEAVRTGARTRTLELNGPPRRVLEVQAQTVRPGGRAPGDGPDGRLGASPGEEDGDVAVALVQDVTERHHLDAMRRDFVANVSHELRTPVGALGALAEALCQEDDPAVMRRLGARIYAEAERAAGLIKDLLDLSRVEGAAGMRREPLVAARVVAEAVGRVRAVADERDIRVVEQGLESGITLSADVGQLISALANLLDNAVKYSDPGSTVTIEIDAEASWVTFRVTDTGIGIPARDHERIFERFYRVDRARSRETGGTGLGLAIVRHVALNHDGRVTVESREGEGSTFSLILPREVP